MSNTTKNSRKIKTDGAAETTTRDRSASPAGYRWVEQAFASARADLVCLSHLRWDFVYQRPQHLMSRFARERRVFYVEEPLFDAEEARLEVRRSREGVHVVVPHLPAGARDEGTAEVMQQGLIERFFAEQRIEEPVLWYYTPMALGFTSRVRALATVYDCMDELSAFKGAPPLLREREKELFRRADLVFTGGQSLYEVKRRQHRSVHAFPSSIEREHFARAREVTPDPPDQSGVARPRLGFFGVIDERFDIELLEGLADARPDWQLVMIGPVVKIDPATLPRRANIHYLGMKSYEELPQYIAGWDAALLLFARNEATRFISPTKTPEYLAAGRPVVSTSIQDVVRPYGELGLVSIADTVGEFVAAVERELREHKDNPEWLARVDGFLAQTSWERTWGRMSELINVVAARRAESALAERQPAVKTSPTAAARAAAGNLSAGASASGD